MYIFICFVDASEGPTLGFPGSKHNPLHNAELEEGVVISETTTLVTTTYDSDGDKEKAKQKQPFQLPHYMLYPAWIMNIGCIMACSFFIIWYGMAFGNTKSLEWLASVTFGLVRIKRLLLLCSYLANINSYKGGFPLSDRTGGFVATSLQKFAE